LNVPDHINESIEAISDLHVRAERRRTAHQRGIERLTNGLGRPSFLYAIVTFVGLWIGINLALPLVGRAAFDPPPFTLLQGLSTFSALLITAMVLITQNHQLKLAERRSRLDLQINLLAERKIAKLIALHEELRRDLPFVRNRHDPEAKAMQTHADPQTVADALEESIDAQVQAEESGESDKAPPEGRVETSGRR
jgi:uncharacterized membrane protein